MFLRSCPEIQLDSNGRQNVPANNRNNAPPPAVSVLALSVHFITAQGPKQCELQGSYERSGNNSPAHLSLELSFKCYCISSIKDRRVEEERERERVTEEERKRESV